VAGVVKRPLAEARATQHSSHDVFLCGNDPEAKRHVGDLLRDFGWPQDCILDLGDISAARGLEAYFLFWVRLWQGLGSGSFNIKVVR